MSPQYSSIKPFSNTINISFNSVENDPTNYLYKNGLNSILIKNKNQPNFIKKDQYKSKDNSMEKYKKYENISDVKTIIKIIKRESRASLIPSLYSKREIDKNSKPLGGLQNSNINEKIRINSANKINNLNLNSRNKIIQLDVNNSNIKNNKNLSQTKIESPKTKFKNNQNKENIINKENIKNNLKLPYTDIKKLNKAVSVGEFNIKNKLKSANKIEINFSPFPEDAKEKDEQKMKKIFNQMKEFLPSDEKILIKDRFKKYGYNKEKYL